MLSLLGVSSVHRFAWVQPKNPLMSAGLGTGTFINLGGFFGPEVEIDAKPAEELAAAYFRIDRTRRHNILRIPLDRLDRAAGDRDLADRAIDLGIALEALLLHEQNKKDRGELRYRLSLRGAWLGGVNEEERREILTSLRDVYDLRSHAVHTGAVDRGNRTDQTIECGTALCKQLIRKAIDVGGDINWESLVLGGPPEGE